MSGQGQAALPPLRSTRGAGPGGPISRGLFGAGAGLGGGYSGHSGRVGLAVRMTARGAPTHAVMLADHWSMSPDRRGTGTLVAEEPP